MDNQVDILSIRLSREMVDWLDSLVTQGFYKSRAEAIRDFAREYFEGQGRQV